MKKARTIIMLFSYSFTIIGWDFLFCQEIVSAMRLANSLARSRLSPYRSNPENALL